MCHHSQLYFVETVDPLTIVKPTLPSGATVAAYTDGVQRYPGLRLRGTSAALPFHKGMGLRGFVARCFERPSLIVSPLSFPAGHLFVVHETVSRGQEYASRFMYLEGGAFCARI